MSSRANLHSECNTNKDCDSKYWVGGDNCIDFIAWAMDTRRYVYMITIGSLQVKVFSPDGLVREEHLASIAPRDDDAVLEYTGDHFNAFMKQAVPILPDVSNCDGILYLNLLSLPSLIISKLSPRMQISKSFQIPIYVNTRKRNGAVPPASQHYYSSRSWAYLGASMTLQRPHRYN